MRRRVQRRRSSQLLVELEPELAPGEGVALSHLQQQQRVQQQQQQQRLH